MRYRLANPRHRLPMPGAAPGAFFPSHKLGVAIDPLSPLYARMIADGDLVAAEDGDDTSDSEPSSSKRARKTKAGAGAAPEAATLPQTASDTPILETDSELEGL